MKTSTKLRIEFDQDCVCAPVSVNVDDPEDFGGALVLVQDGDTIVVPAEEAVPFVKALLEWLSRAES